MRGIYGSMRFFRRLACDGLYFKVQLGISGYSLRGFFDAIADYMHLRIMQYLWCGVARCLWVVYMV